MLDIREEVLKNANNKEKFQRFWKTTSKQMQITKTNTIVTNFAAAALKSEVNRRNPSLSIVDELE
ncbi:MAG: hypothetical protein ACLS8T_23850 [Anaerobutyricum sp.]